MTYYAATNRQAGSVGESATDRAVRPQSRMRAGRSSDTMRRMKPPRKERPAPNVRLKAGDVFEFDGAFLKNPSSRYAEAKLFKKGKRLVSVQDLTLDELDRECAQAESAFSEASMDGPHSALVRALALVNTLQAEISARVEECLLRPVTVQVTAKGQGRTK